MASWSHPDPPDRPADPLFFHGLVFGLVLSLVCFWLPLALLLWWLT